MANIRKTDKPLQAKGLSVQTAYLVIDDFAKLDKQQKIATYYVDVYADSTLRNDRANLIIKRAAETCAGEDFDKYFSTPEQSVMGKNPHKAAYQHLLTITEQVENPDFNSELDESEENPRYLEQLKYGDWESDE